MNFFFFCYRRNLFLCEKTNFRLRRHLTMNLLFAALSSTWNCGHEDCESTILLLSSTRPPLTPYL